MIDRPARAASLVAALAAAGGCSVAWVSLRQAPDVPPARPTCAPGAAAPPLNEPRFAGTFSGELSLVRAEGDARLSADDHFTDAYSPDGSLVAFADHGAITTWRTSDGTLVDLARCSPHNVLGRVAFSPDGREVTFYGTQRDHYDEPMVCILDRRTGRTRIDDLASLPDEPVHDTALEALSHDGKLRVRWPMCEGRDDAIVRTKGAGDRPMLMPTLAAGPSFTLQVEDVETGRVLWKEPSHGCDGWRFTPDNRLLEAWPFSGHELIEARTGKHVAFPGRLQPVSPDSRRVVVNTATGPQLWWTTGQPIVAAARHRRVMARSPDGAVTVTSDLEGYPLLERAGRCSPLDTIGSFEGPPAFTADGSELHAVENRGNGSYFRAWSAATAARLSTLVIDGGGVFYPMPAKGWIGVGTLGGIRVFDAHTRAAVRVARAPRKRLGPYRHPQGRSFVRDPDGDQPDQLHAYAGVDGDGRHVVGTTRLEKQVVTIWDLEDPRAVIDMPVDQRIQLTAMAADGGFVAASGEWGEFHLWDRTGREIPVTVKHFRPARALVFSPSGDRLAVALEDGTVHLVDTKTGAATGTATLPSQRAAFVWWSQDGGRLLIDTTRHLHFEAAVTRR